MKAAIYSEKLIFPQSTLLLKALKALIEDDPVYQPDKKLQAFLYGLTEGKRTIRGISRCLKTTVAQLFLDLEKAISYTTLNRFWHRLDIVVEQLFKDLVQVANSIGLYGDSQAADTTSIETPFQDDPDAIE